MVLLELSLQINFPTAPEKSLQQIYTPGVCHLTGDIYSSASSYSKSFCLVFINLPFLDHRLFASQNKMRLFKMNSAAANRTITDFLSIKWPRNNQSFFVEHRNAIGCNSLKNVNGTYMFESEDCAGKTLALAEYRNLEREYNTHS